MEAKEVARNMNGIAKGFDDWLSPEEHKPDHVMNERVDQITSQPMDDWAGWEWRTFHAVAKGESFEKTIAARTVRTRMAAEIRNIIKYSVLVWSEKSEGDFGVHRRGKISNACITKRFGRKVRSPVKGLMATLKREMSTLSQSLGLARELFGRGDG